MTCAEFEKALSRARRVFVVVRCTSTVQYFAVSKTEAKRVLLGVHGDVIAIVRESALYLG